jgi:hypothetical protein
VAVRFWQGLYSWRRFAVTSALLVCADFLISAERATMTVIALAMIGLLDLLQRGWRQRWRDVLCGYGTSAAIIAVVLAVPIWYFFKGPGAISGPPHLFVSKIVTTVCNVASWQHVRVGCRLLVACPIR